jgi:hypothetical protein
VDGGYRHRTDPRHGRWPGLRVPRQPQIRVRRRSVS